VVTSDPQLDTAIGAVSEWAGCRIAATPITAGITNRNFRVDVDDETFVVRLAGVDTHLLGIDRASEHAAGRAAAAAGVGPEIFKYLPHLGCLITRFVQGASIPTEDLERQEILASVVGSIRAFHACPTIPSTFPVFRICESYARLAAERGVSVPKEWDDAHTTGARIESAMSRAPMMPVPCHNDLLNANFLLDGAHTWIVDYEYGGMGDPFFDLGNLSINNGLSEEAQNTLLRLYFGAPRDVHRARLALMRIVSDMREAMWGVLQQAISTLDFDYVDYADRHFSRLLRNAEDPRFRDWLDGASEVV
jgi:aminoglycoside phosphotransferase (APT) family kinase protein